MSAAVVATIGGTALGASIGVGALGASIGGLAAGALGGAVGGFLGGGIGGEISGQGWNHDAVTGLLGGAVGGGLYGSGIFDLAGGAGSTAGAASAAPGEAGLAAPAAGIGATGATSGALGTGGALTAGTGMTSAQVSSLLSGGLKALSLSQALGRMTQQANAFGPYRSQYAQQLSQLEANPSTITNLPGYSAGLQAVQRSLASQGYSGSGNMMAALQGYGEQFYNNQVQTLAGLAGANINPAIPANMLTTGGNYAIGGLGMLSQGALGQGGLL